ncbi:MAG: GxxExxY protein [Victivallales bacterium]|nr:GxxExxY protein [Victivallales bacterium]
MTQHQSSEILFPEETYAVQGAIFEVYRHLGCGFLEAVYQESLELELQARHIPFVAQRELAVSYKGMQLKQKYVADIICYGKLLVELKATEKLLPAFESQVLNYLCISNLKLGLLVNFGHFPGVEIKRLVKSH